MKKSSKHKSPKISFYIITKNEETRLDKCLSSIKKLASEIIVVDSQSTDGTKNIAKKYNARFFIKSFRNDLSSQRNYALSKTRFKWILTLDADECLSTDLQQSIPLLVKSKKYRGYWFSRKTFIGKNKYLKYGYFYPDFQIRLFRKTKKINYSGRLHEHLNISLLTTAYLTQDILHYPKNNRYTRISSILSLTWYIRLQGQNYLDEGKNPATYLLLSLTVFPYHFIGSYIRGKGFLDGINGFKAAFIFAFLLSVSYMYAFFFSLRNNLELKFNSIFLIFYI